MAIIDLANPTRFLRFAHRAHPWLMEITGAVFVIGLYLTYGAPDDYQQGATVKIMFIHVPSAWLGMFGWALMSAAALGTLVWRHPLADVAAKAAPVISISHGCARWANRRKRVGLARSMMAMRLPTPFPAARLLRRRRYRRRGSSASARTGS